MRSALPLVLLSVLAVLAGCGHPPPVEDGGTALDAGAQDAGAGEDGGARDAGAADAGVADAGRADAGGPTDAGQVDAGAHDGGAALHFGGVNLTAVPFATGYRYVSGAHFSDRATAPDCARAVVTAGACCFVPPAEGGAPFTAASAGAISMANATTAFSYPTLTPDDGGSYFGFSWTSPDWMEGDRLEASSVGGQVEPFALSVLAPAPIQGISPAWSRSTSLSIPRGVDFTVRWTPGKVSGATMALLMGAQEPTGANPAVRGAILCEVPDSAGSLTVAASLLSRFSAGDLCFVCGLTRAVRAQVSSASAQVELRVSVLGGGGATFQ